MRAFFFKSILTPLWHHFHRRRKNVHKRMTLGLFGSLCIVFAIVACGSLDVGSITSDINGDAAVDTGVDAADTGVDVVSDALVSLDAAPDVVQADVVADTATPGACGVCGPHAACVGTTCTPGFRVFVTSQTYTAQLGGYDGAALLCQNTANAAGLAGTWAAWMSGALAGEKEPAFSFTKGTNYQLLNGTFLAADLGGLNEIKHAINRDETDTQVAAGQHVWTNTNAFGTANVYACGDMNSANLNDGNGGYGRTDATFTLYADGGFAPSPSWAYVGVDPCGTMSHLFCFEQ
jgi:hypothetical protein